MSAQLSILTDFLICSERSGSNLIRAIMDSHSDVYAPPPLHLSELWLDVHYYGNLTVDENWSRLITEVVRKFNFRKESLSFSVTEQELLDEVVERDFAEIYRFIYKKGMMEAGKSRIFLKENHTHRLLGILHQHFPQAKFVYQVRDPRDFLLSCKKVFASKWRMHYGTVPNAVEIWRNDQDRSLNAIATMSSDKIFPQRYEDLVAHPENVVGTLCQFLGLPFESSMLDFHKGKPAERAASSKPKYWQNLTKPVMKDNFGKYREGLSKTELGFVELRTKRLMCLLGYELETAPSAIKKAWYECYGVWVDIVAKDTLQDFRAWLRRMMANTPVKSPLPKSMALHYPYLDEDLEKTSRH